MSISKPDLRARIAKKAEELGFAALGIARADAAPTHPLLNRALRAWLDLESRLALRARLPFGVTVFAVAEKPAAPPPR